MPWRSLKVAGSLFLVQMSGYFTKALCPSWMRPGLPRPVSVSSGRQACSEDAAAGPGPGAGMLCVLFKHWLVSLQVLRRQEKEVAACLHSWIVLYPPSVSNALLFKHSQVREMTPADAGVHSSASALHLNVVCQPSSSEMPIATTFYSGCLLPRPAGLDDG